MDQHKGIQKVTFHSQKVTSRTKKVTFDIKNVTYQKTAAVDRLKKKSKIEMTWTKSYIKGEPLKNIVAISVFSKKKLKLTCKTPPFDGHIAEGDKYFKKKLYISRTSG